MTAHRHVAKERPTEPREIEKYRADAKLFGLRRKGDGAALRGDPVRGIVYRPVEPGSFPLVAGATSRVGRLRAYGNAIVPPLAAEFVGAVIDALIEAG